MYVVGRVNCGKSTFVNRFLHYVGYRRVWQLPGLELVILLKAPGRGALQARSGGCHKVTSATALVQPV